MLDRRRGSAPIRSDFALETLEARQLLATHTVADFFPLETGSTWNYSGAVNGEAATNATTLNAGPNRNGGTTFELASILDMTENDDVFTTSRLYSHRNNGLRLFQDDTTFPSGSLSVMYPAGLRLLPPSVDDGQVISFNKQFNGNLDGQAYMGRLVGSLTVNGIETIDTTAGSFQALKVSMTSVVRQNGVDVGMVAETRWLVENVGTVRLDYVMAVHPDGLDEAVLRVNMGLTESSLLGSVTDIEVTGRNVVIPLGDTTPTTNDWTSFAGVDVNGGTKTRIYKIFNQSDQPMTLATGTHGFISLSGANVSEFTVVRQPSQVIQPGQFTRFSVRFDPADTGFRTARVSVASAADTAHPMFFDIRGTGIFIGAINVFGGNASPISSGSTNTNAGNGTRFGQIQETGSASIVRSFTITNTGVGNLVLTGTPFVSIGGAQSEDFAVAELPSGVIAPGASSTFSVRFDPTFTGGRRATVSIASNDRFQPLFTFDVVGTGV